MKTAERFLGFASCALGLLPLIGDPAKAQQAGAISCQNVFASFASGTTTAPVLLNGGTQRFVICGYSLATIGTNTAITQLLSGYGSACATSNGFTQTQISIQQPASGSVNRSGLAVVLAPGASVCYQTGVANGGTTFASVEINYSLQ